MKKNRKKTRLVATTLLLFGLVFFSFLAAPQSFVFAQVCPEEGLSGVDFLVFQGPLVPCGVKDPCGNPETCTLCHLLVLVENIFNLMMSLLIIVSLVFITIGGVMYIVSTGRPAIKEMGKGIITKTLMGFGIFLLSWLLVLTILMFISLNFSTINKGGLWYKIQCNTTSQFSPPTP